MVDRVGDRAARARQVPQQRVAVQQAERARDLVLLLEHQPVKAPPGDLVQHMACVEDLLIGGAYSRARRGRDPGRGDRLDRVHVPLPAARFLEVRLQQEGELAVQPGSLVVQFLELGEPGPGVAPPVFEGALAQPGGQVGVARDVPGVEQPEGDLEVAAGHPSGLRHGPHRVVKPGAGVPDRVPDPVSDLGDAVSAVMQQEHVKIAAGEQFLAAVAANSDEGDAGLRPQHPGQPAIGFCSPSATISRERGHDSHQVPRVVTCTPYGALAVPVPLLCIRLDLAGGSDRVGAALSGTDPDDRLDRQRPIPCRRRSGPSAPP